MPRVVVHRRWKLLREYDLSRNQIMVVGEHPTNDIVLPDASRRVSRHHAALVPRASDGRHFVRDLASLRGTQVAGRTIDRHLLRNGDVIEIGDYTLVFSDASTAVPVKSAFLTVVSKRKTDASEASTNARGRSDGVCREMLTLQRSKLFDHLSRTRANGADLRTVLDGFGPLLVKIMRADRGFIRLFPEDDLGSDEDLGVAGLNARDSIGITESAFMERLLAGRSVRDGSTLLVPLICQSRTVGFFCLDRHRVPGPFTDEESHFLIGVGQATMTLRDVPASLASREPEGPIRWDDHIVGRSLEIQKVLAEIRKAAKSSANILLIAETGSGKQLAARAIWQHARPAGPFIAKDCGRTVRSISETELFGHAPHAQLWNANPAGAPGWFEMASGGTLFLDEIQNLSASTQKKILRVLQERKIWRYAGQSPTQVDVKVIAATSVVDLETAIDQGRFQKDLYHHFRRIRLPPLRARRDDIPLLAFYFLDRRAAALGVKTRRISRRALEMLRGYDWPGNVRELEAKILEAVSPNNEVIFSWDLDLPVETRSGAVRSIDDCAQPAGSSWRH